MSATIRSLYSHNRLFTTVSRPPENDTFFWHVNRRGSLTCSQPVNMRRLGCWYRHVPKAGHFFGIGDHVVFMMKGSINRILDNLFLTSRYCRSKRITITVNVVLAKSIQHVLEVHLSLFF